jgi:protein-S-isoprenylcysteine O-methyltransferase Ste14
MMKLEGKAWVSLAILAMVMSLLVLVPAGTVRYWEGWLYLAVFTLASGLITLYLMRNDPALLERRMKGGPSAEQLPVQKVIMVFTSIGFIALLVVPALEFRLAGAAAPAPVVLLGDALVALGFWFIALVYRENTFTSAIIEVAPDQRVISTGPYAIVRHPMYAGGALYLAGTPLALGSYRGLLVTLAMLPFLIWRLVDEERLLARKLPGYTEYQRRVRHRLVPFIW